MTYDPIWPEILKRQDALLKFDSLTNEDALTLGLYALDQDWRPVLHPTEAVPVMETR